MNNPLGIHYGCFVTDWMENQQDLIPKAKALGFDLLEFGAAWLVEMDDAAIAEFKAMAEDNGVLLAMSLGLPVELDVSSADSSVRKAGLDFLIKLAAAMEKVGAPSCSGIVHGAWNGRIQDYKEKSERWNISVKSMKEASKAFADHGVKFNVEVVNRFENFLVNSCAEAIQYIDEVGSPQIGIHLDTFHMNIEEDSQVDAILTAGKRLGYFHIGENNRKFPGLGTMPWKDIFSALKGADYRGPITMEPFVKPGGEVGSAVSLYRPLMNPSLMDENLKKSVAFVRGLMSE